MDFIYAFLVGGAICVVGQVLLDFAKLTPAHLMATFVVIGAVLDGFGLYDNLIKFAWCWCDSSYHKFWAFLLHGAMHAAEKHGYIGIGMGMFSLTSAGISAAILFSFL
ncbi:stage V sporulation protein AE [Bacillus cereus]